MGDGSLTALWEQFNRFRDLGIETSTKVKEIEKSQEKTEARIEKEIKALEDQIKQVEANVIGEVKELANEVRASGKRSILEEFKRPQTVIVSLVGAIVILVEVMAKMANSG